LRVVVAAAAENDAQFHFRV